MQVHLTAVQTTSVAAGLHTSKRNECAQHGGCALAHAAEPRSRGHAAAACDECLVYDTLRKQCRQHGKCVIICAGCSITAARLACANNKAMSELPGKDIPRLKTVTWRAAPSALVMGGA